MSRGNDPQHRLKREKERVAELPTSDADAITEFLRALDGDDLSYQYTENGTTDTKAVSTLEAYGRALRLLTEEFSSPLLDLSSQEFNDQFSQWKGDLADKTIKQRQSAVIKFLRYHEEDATANAEDIILINVDGAQESIDPKDVLTGEEIEAMRDACNTVRDRCLIDLLAYTGQRIRAIQTLRLKDVDPNAGASGRYRLNTAELGLKGADKSGEKRPLLGAQKSVREWMQMHPTGKPEDYLITALPSSNRPNGTADGDYLGRTSIRSRLLDIADRAGVDKDVNPHAFRHFFVTTCKRDYDMEDSDIKYLIGHDASSRVMETTYSHLSDEERSVNVEESYGYEVEPEKSPLTPPTCPTCDEPLPDKAKSCSACGTVFTPDAKSVERQIKHTVQEAKEGTETLEEHRDLDRLERLVDENPELLNVLENLVDE